MSLKPTPPHDAKNRYLNDKKPGVTKKTFKNYRTMTRQFCDWLDGQGITDLTTSIARLSSDLRNTACRT
ncbi:hypothetical protein HALLA_05850 [Halostagnicola larsenii XH-48]|uniref:Core-binding (CB) domain-containing protein n=1 Tax=Halostagnicola larsenii XH-48 TaxID=797299 RepID=W0JTV5_9EURY|nr:hypothetical protein [Halostagnicola larsenii]AHG00737.1 hypothetical protein HALLA_05850 [Halostagnicola larsenii XH-48]